MFTSQFTLKYPSTSNLHPRSLLPVSTSSNTAPNSHLRSTFPRPLLLQRFISIFQSPLLVSAAHQQQLQGASTCIYRSSSPAFVRSSPHQSATSSKFEGHQNRFKEFETSVASSIRKPGALLPPSAVDPGVRARPSSSISRSSRANKRSFPTC